MGTFSGSQALDGKIKFGAQKVNVGPFTTFLQQFVLQLFINDQQKRIVFRK